MGTITHGYTRGAKTKLYKTWLGMKKRCYQKTSVSYRNYGERGITVCDEWLHDFIAFKNWADANGYDESKDRTHQQLDRINNDGQYAPNNCRFTDAKTQANNRRERAFRVVEQRSLNGEVLRLFKSARDAARSLGMCRETITKACNVGATAYGYKWMWR